MLTSVAPTVPTVLHGQDLLKQTPEQANSREKFRKMLAFAETELMAKFLAKDVPSWLGHSEPVAMKHYAMATEASLKAAAGLDGCSITGISQARSSVIAESIKPGKHLKSSGLMTTDSAKDMAEMTPTGLEPVLPP